MTDDNKAAEQQASIIAPSQKERLEAFLDAYPDRRELVSREYLSLVPDFVDADWVAARIKAGNRFRVHVASRWNAKQHLAPFVALPYGAPTAEQLPQIIADMLRHVDGAGIILDASDEEFPFPGPFTRWLLAEVEAGTELSGTMEDTYQSLLEGGHVDTVRDAIVLYGLFTPAKRAENLVRWVNSLGEAVADLLPFMHQAIKAHEGRLETARASIAFLPVLENDLHPVSAYAPAFDGLPPTPIEGELPKSPPAPGVTAKWLTDKVGAMSGAVRSKLNGLGEPLRALTGQADFWPAQKLGNEGLIEQLARCFEHPLVLPSISLTVEREKQAHVRENSVFRPFYRKVYAEVADANGERDAVDQYTSMADVDLLAELLELELIPQARDFAVLRGAEMVREEFVELLRDDFPELLAENNSLQEVANYLIARRYRRAWLSQNGHGATVATLVRLATNELSDRRGRRDPRTPVAIVDREVVEISRELPKMPPPPAEMAETTPAEAAPQQPQVRENDNMKIEPSPAADAMRNDPVRAASVRHSALLDQIADVAKLAASNAPEQGAIDLIVGLVAQLGGSLFAYEAATKLVSADDYVSRTAIARDTIITLADKVGVDHSAVVEIEPIGHLTATGAARIDQGLVSTEKAIVRASGVHHDVVTLIEQQNSETKLLAKAEIGRKVDQQTGVLTDEIGTAVERYREVVDLFAAEAPDTVPADLKAEPDVAETAGSTLAQAQVAPAVVVVDAVAEAPEQVTEPVTPTAPIVPAPVGIEAEFNTTDEDDEILIEQAEIAELTAAVPTAVETPPLRADDPEIALINAKTWSLLSDGAIGLAYHLVASAEVIYPGAKLDFSSNELRVAAMAGNMNHASLLATPASVESAVLEVLPVVSAIPSQLTGKPAARRMMLYPAAIEMELFHPTSGAGEVLRLLNGLTETLGESVRALTSSVLKLSRLHISLSPSVLQAISGQMAASDDAAASKNELLAKIDQFSRSNYNFALTIKIRNVLLMSGNGVGDLRDGLKGDDKAALAAAQSYVDRYSSHPQIMDMLSRAEVQATSYFRGLDGSSRDKIVGLLSDIAHLAAEYLERRRAARAVTETDRPKLTEAVAELRQCLKAVREKLSKGGGNADEPSIAAKHAARALGTLDDVLSGTATSVPAFGIRRALHADLVLLPSLHFGHSWMPAPFDKGEIVQTILETQLPILPTDQNGRDASYETIFRRRIADASFGGAKLMVDLADYYGISNRVAGKVAVAFDAELETAQENLLRRVDATRELVERVIRFGSIAKPEEAQRHLSTVDRVAQADVPADVSLEERTETADESRIDDVRLAALLLDEVAFEVRDLLEKPRNQLLAEIANLEGRLNPKDIAHLRSLCDDDDLLTAGEFVSFAKVNGEIPTARSRGHRFEKFTTSVLPVLAKTDGTNAAAADALSGGQVYAGLPFNRLSEARRSEAAEVLSAWRDLFRQTHAVKDSGFTARVAAFLEKVGAVAKPRSLSSMTNAARKQFVSDFEFSIPRDAESLVLPDFGSLTGHNFRIALMNTLPSEATLAELCRTAGQMGVLLLVGDVVTPERRTQFLLQNIEARRRIILVDTASLLFALSEPEMRVSTLIELGQPYSYAAPYRDWERDAVPPEMFVGRRGELSTLLDPHGSCIVYGGRRLGKTALLKHFKATQNDPDHGLLIGFVDAQGLGHGQRLTRQIWERISESLPTLFNREVSDPKRVVDTISTWLGGDPRRRIIVLIDEADDFVKADAAQNYPEFLALQKLMTDTRRRFKIVLSGLHNVTRLVQTGNDPIKQISSMPQRIGPIMNTELGDAEDLIVRPFAALGVEFERRADVWSLLSRANYFPVLVQTYAKHLLDAVFDEAKRTGQPVRVLTHAMVEAVFEGRQAVDEVKDKFLLTLRIDQRYELIAYVVANLVLTNEASGVIDEGVTIAQIRDTAIQFWPKGFADNGRISLFEDLVDEMEGLAILRRTPSDRWTLRSPAVTRLLGSADDVDAFLIEFSNRDAPGEFDPKSSRRFLEPLMGYNLESRRPSPLTLGQERDILTDPTPAKLVFGTSAADIDLVSLSLRSATASFSDVERFEVVVSMFLEKGDMLDRLSSVRTNQKNNVQTVLVVDSRTDWEPDWVAAAVRHRSVTDKAAKVVFVGRPSHAERVAMDASLSRIANVRTINLEPWSAAFAESQIVHRCPTLNPARRKSLLVASGGWNGPMSHVFYGQGGQKVETRVDKIGAEWSGEEAISRFGLAGAFGDVVKAVASVTSHRFTAEDLATALSFPEIRKDGGALWKSAEAVLSYGTKIGAFHVIPSPTVEDAGKTIYELSSVALRLLGLAPEEHA